MSQDDAYFHIHQNDPVVAVFVEVDVDVNDVVDVDFYVNSCCC